MAYPSTIDSPTPNVDNVDIIYAADVNELQTAVVALETKVGVDGSAVTSTHDYKLGEVTSTDKAVGKTATQTLTNKTLTSPTITGATITTSTLNGVTIQTAGSATDFLAANGTYQTGAVSNASTTAKGIVEIATSAEITAGTGTGSTGAVIAISPDGLAASTPVFNGSGLTNVVASANGTTTKNAADASATQTIAHGLGKTPKTVEIFCTLAWVTVSVAGSGRDVNLYASTFYNGTTQSSQSFYAISNNVSQGATFTLNTANANDTTVGVVTFDATNISIAWTKTGSPTGTYNLLWRAVA